MKFSRDEKLLLIIVGVYTLASTMVTTFANVYLLNYSKSLVVMSIYSLIRYGMLGVFAVLSAKLSTKVKMSYSLTIGLVLITSAVLFLLSVKDRIGVDTYLIYLVGFVWGAGEGFFWITFNTLQQVITNIETRGYYLGISGVLTYVATIVAPVLSSLILSLTAVELQGYYLMFQLAIVIFVFIAILSFFLQSTKPGKKFSLKNSFLGIKTDRNWRYIVVAQFFWGIREAATVSLTGLLIYEALGSSTVYGRWLSFFAVLATISNYLCGRTVNKRNRIACLTVGGIGLFCSGLLLLLGNQFGALAHGAFHYTFLAWAATPFSVIAMNVISEYMPYENVMGRTLTRELMIAIGRVLGLGIVIACALFVPGKTGMNIGLFILYLGCLGFVFTNRYFHQKVNIK